MTAITDLATIISKGLASNVNRDELANKTRETLEALDVIRNN